MKTKPQTDTNAASTETRPLLRVSNLSISFGLEDGSQVQAVNRVNISVFAGQVVSLVGESGCGKSVTALSMLRLLPEPPAQVHAQAIELQGRDLTKLSPAQIRDVRGSEIAMIFQEPMTSLNPVFSIGDQLTEAVALHQKVGRREAREIAAIALGEVGIAEPLKRMREYPHQFSGGMRQRVMIAMGLVCQPKLLVADEPTTALDVTTQAEVLKQLEKLACERDMGILLITHDLGLVRQHSDVVYVMYGGHICECATVANLFEAPLHPYTRGLLASIPRMGERVDRLLTIDQTLEDPRAREVIPGTPGLQPWWPHWSDQTDKEPILWEVAEDHWVLCQSPDKALGSPQRRPEVASGRFRSSVS